MSTDNKLKLRCLDNEILEVEELVASKSLLLKTIIEDIGTEGVVPLPRIRSSVMAKVIEYCRYHVESDTSSGERPEVSEDSVKEWDAEFLRVDQSTLFDIMLAADFLNIQDLLELTFEIVRDMIRGKTPDEIRKTFNLK